MSQLSPEKKQIKIILKISDSTTLYAQISFLLGLVIHCEVHCRKFKNCLIYNLKTVMDSNTIPTDLSKGGAIESYRMF